MWGISEPIKLALCSRGQGREGERTADHYKELTKRTCTTEYTDAAWGAVGTLGIVWAEWRQHTEKADGAWSGSRQRSTRPPAEQG